MFLYDLKSSNDRFIIASLAAEFSSLAREKQIKGIPLDFWATNFAYAAPDMQKA